MRVKDTNDNIEIGDAFSKLIHVTYLRTIKLYLNRYMQENSLIKETLMNRCIYDFIGAWYCNR